MFLPLPFVLNAIPSATLFKILIFNPRTYRRGGGGGGGGRGGGGGGGEGLRFKVFLSFFLDKTSASAPDVFSSCSVIPRADFETSLVMVSCYGYEVKPILGEITFFKTSFTNKSKSCG